MGDYTRFELTVVEGDDELIKEFRKECDDAASSIDEDGYTEDSSKWYDHEDDIRNFSKKHPDSLFLLHGEVEGSTDLWDLYVKNGKAQKCVGEIVYPDFDEDKLK